MKQTECSKRLALKTGVHCCILKMKPRLKLNNDRSDNLSKSSRLEVDQKLKEEMREKKHTTK